MKSAFALSLMSLERYALSLISLERYALSLMSLGASLQECITYYLLLELLTYYLNYLLSFLPQSLSVAILGSLLRVGLLLHDLARLLLRDWQGVEVPGLLYVPVGADGELVRVVVYAFCLSAFGIAAGVPREVVVEVVVETQVVVGGA